METKDDANNLVPGQGRPANLDQLRRLASRGPMAADAPLEAPPAAKPRRIQRAGRAWIGALAVGAALSAVGALALQDRDGLPARLRNPPPALPDQGLSAAERERLWSLADYEPSGFPALLGVSESGAAGRERDAGQFHRLLSGSVRPGPE